MLQKFLKEVMVIVAGKQAEELADLLNSKKHMNEFLIAKKLDITINQTRNLLYKISDNGLVSFIRKKDKRKGWYTYFWKIEILKSLEFLRNILVKRIEQVMNQIKSRETKMFYVCERCNIEFNEENALLHNFMCDECGDIFTEKDNSKVLKEFNRLLDKLEKELKLVEDEIGKEKEKYDKIKLREFKKEEKLVAEKKAEKKAARAKLSKKKPAKKKILKKKVVKKKVVKKKIPQKKVVKKKPVKKVAKKK
jgi:transcription factor E